MSKDTWATVCILGNYALMYYLHLLVEALRFRRTFYSRWVPLAFGLSGSTCKAAGFFVDPISGGCAFIAVESPLNLLFDFIRLVRSFCGLREGCVPLFGISRGAALGVVAILTPLSLSVPCLQTRAAMVPLFLCHLSFPTLPLPC